jgi:cupin 2 domain-containing protein
MKNLFKDIPVNLNEEFFETILKNDNFFIERIISKGHKTPKGEWLSQNLNEWVILLKGEAEISFKKNGKVIKLKPGDYLLIKANEYHRVESTMQNEESVWLAIHFK